MSRSNTADAPLVKHVYAASDDVRVRESMLLGALLEGGSWSGPWAVGDHGTSGGPFQIHYTVHPQVVAEARRRGISPIAITEDPAYAVSFMSGEYRAAVDKVPADLWRSNPELASEKAAMLAERPAKDYYATHGQPAVHNAWQTTAGLVGGGAAVGLPDPPAAGSQSTGNPATPAATGDAGDTNDGGSGDPGTVHIHVPIPYAPDINFDLPWARISLFILGGVLLVVGLKLTFGSMVATAIAPPMPAMPAAKQQPAPEPT